MVQSEAPTKLQQISHDLSNETQEISQLWRKNPSCFAVSCCLQVSDATGSASQPKEWIACGIGCSKGKQQRDRKGSNVGEPSEKAIFNLLQVLQSYVLRPLIPN